MGLQNWIPIRYRATYNAGDSFDGNTALRKSARTKEVNVTEYFCPTLGMMVGVDLERKGKTNKMRFTQIC